MKNHDKIIEWIYRMAQRYDGIVYSKDGHQYDWGQALCVEQYGADHTLWPDEPSDEDVERAKRWEEGDIPDWVDQTLTRRDNH